LNLRETSVFGSRADFRDINLDRLGSDGLGEVDGETSRCIVRKNTEGYSSTVGEDDSSSENLISGIGSVLRETKRSGELAAT
jgi:hypothetical protein